MGPSCFFANSKKKGERRRKNFHFCSEDVLQKNDGRWQQGPHRGVAKVCARTIQVLVDTCHFPQRLFLHTIITELALSVLCLSATLSLSLPLSCSTCVRASVLTCILDVSSDFLLRSVSNHCCVPSSGCVPSSFALVATAAAAILLLTSRKKEKIY